MNVTRHNVEYVVDQAWGRMNALAWTYCEIAQNALTRLLTEQASPVHDPGSDADPTAYLAYGNRMLTAAIQTIVFSGMAAEAAAYDLAAIHLGDDYAIGTLDKLDVVAKWIVVPSLICGSSLRVDGPSINALRTLVRARNALVHQKSQQVKIDAAHFERGDAQMAQILKDATIAYQAIILLSLELNRVLKSPAGVLPFFEAHIWEPTAASVAPSLKKFIERCRVIHARSEP